MTDRFFEWHIASGKHEPNDLGIVRPGALVIEPSATLAFVIEYPLEKSYAFSETHADGTGWTELQFCRAVSRAYRHVYKTPDKYGVWGHGIDDLYLEGARKTRKGWALEVGS